MTERARPQHWNHSLANPGPEQKTLFSIEQDVAPAIAEKVPPWLRGLLRRICAAAVNDIYHVCPHALPSDPATIQKLS